MRQTAKLRLGEFLGDIRLILSAPAHRFAVIQERGASWGSLLLLILPAYFAFSFAGGIYFDRDPFPGYSFLPPLLVAVASVYLKLWLIHVVARLFQGKQTGSGRGRFCDLKVVFGYTQVPSLAAILLAVALFVLIPQDLGYLFRNFRAISVSILAALGIALFIWSLILVVLAMRTVYAMRDLRLLLAYILGSVLMVIPVLCTLWIVSTTHIEFSYVQPIVSGRLLRFFVSDPTSSISSDTRIQVHIDKLCYRLREPQRFELVAYALSGKRPRGKQYGGTVLVGSESGFTWEEGDYALGRIVGLPGDTVALDRGSLSLNGTVWAEPYLDPQYCSDESLPPKTLSASEYFILPENRQLIPMLADELVVKRDRILGREIVSRWPVGWLNFRSTIFLQPHPDGHSALQQGIQK